MVTMNNRTNTRMPDATYRAGAVAVAQRPDPWTAFFNAIDVRLTGETRQQYGASVTAQGIAWNVRQGTLSAVIGLRNIQAVGNQLAMTKQDALRRLEDALKTSPP
jgi:hypothetical protein